MIAISIDARPGVYRVDVAVLNAREGRALASSRIPAYMLVSLIAEQALEDVDRIGEICGERGI